MRQFETGATRDAEGDKYDYEGFFAPLVVEAYGRYMHKHRKQADGNLRDSDNWQKGIPKNVYIKSLWRHFYQLWALHRDHAVKDEKGNPVDIESACCAIMFNVMGYLFEHQRVPEDFCCGATQAAPISEYRYFTHSEGSDGISVFVFEKTSAPDSGGQRFRISPKGELAFAGDRGFWKLGEMFCQKVWEVAPVEINPKEIISISGFPLSKLPIKI